MSTTVNVHEAKTNLSELLNKALRGEEVIIARSNVPVVRLVPVTPTPKKRVAGLNRGKLHMAADFDAPLPGSFWLGGADDPLRAPLSASGLDPAPPHRAKSTPTRRR